MSYIYKITEKDVDGCGTNVEEYVSSDTKLTETESSELSRILAAVQGLSCSEGYEDMETGDMVEEALRRFEGATGKKLTMTSSPFAGTFTF